MDTHATLFLPLRVTFFRTLNSSGLLMTVSTRRMRPALSYIFSQFSLTRCLIRDPSMRQAQLERSETISPSKLPRSFRPRKFMTSLAPKHKVPWLSSFGIEFGKMLTAFEQDVGRQFALSGDPVVLRVLQNVLELGCDE